MAIPNEPTFPGEIKEEVLSRADAISLSLDEVKIKKILRKRIEDGEAFWNKKLNLKQVREDNEKRWLNQNLEVHSSLDELYEHQVPYRDNRIFISVETLLANIVSRIPTPEVIEAQDTDASRELATNYSKVLYRKSEDHHLKAKFQMIARHLLMGYRVGIMKTTWDFNAGRLLPDGSHTGDIVVNWVRPHRIIVDAEAEDPYDLPLIAENLTLTVEELGIQFPKKKDELVKLAGAEKGTQRVGMGTKIGYYEIWFSFYDDDGIKREAVCWKYKDLLLDYGINPNFNYDNPEKSNFFDSPRNPYTFFNFLRIGRWVFDDTSLTEQAAILQDILEKRGRQIVENADQAYSAKVFNTMMINAKDAEKYTGDPRRNILCKGDVRMAYTHIPPRELAKYVFEDKIDARQEIDNIFATHAPLRGERTRSPTLGQEVISQRSDIGRQTTLGEAIETGAVDVYKHMTQLYKVFADKEHFVKYTGQEGETTFVKFSKDKIEDGIEIRIQPGSMKADDKLADRTEAVELAKVGGRIDPLSFAEKWHFDKPREMARRLFYFLFMPDRYAEEVLGIGAGGGDQEAMQTIQRINAGENVPPKEDISTEYAAYYRQYLESPAFKQLNPEVQRLHFEHVRGMVESAKGGLKQGAEKEGGQKPGIRDRIKGLIGR